VGVWGLGGGWGGGGVGADFLHPWGVSVTVFPVVDSSPKISIGTYFLSLQTFPLL